MRIAFLCNRFAPSIGGIEIQVALLAKELVRRGHEVSVLTRRYARVLPACEILDGIRVERFRPYGLGVMSKWLLNFGTFWRIVSCRPGFDCVLVTQFSATVLGPALANALRGTPLILVTAELGEFGGAVSERSLEHLPRLLRCLVRRVLGGLRHRAYQRACSVVAISTALAQEARSAGFPARSATLIPNALDTIRFHPVTSEEKAALRVALQIPRRVQVVISVGRLVQGKGLLTLVEAWLRVTKKHTDALLVIVGAGGGPNSSLDVERRVREEVRAVGIGGSVQFRGAVSDVERYLQASDLFVFPSESEGFGIALAEAMSCGLPVICGRISGAASDLVVEEEHGLKFDTGDATLLAEQINRLLANESDRQRLGSAARMLVEARLGIGPIADAYEQIIHAAASG